MLIPEKWENIYLYASVIKQMNNIETWEMYFYYTPKGLIKRKEINVYEIPILFNIDEKEYLKLVDNLCNTIKQLNVVYKKTYDKNWSSVVITIKDLKFTVEYSNENLLKSKYSSQDRHLIFKYKYLNMPLQRFSKNERILLQEYLEKNESKEVYDSYCEYIQDEKLYNYIQYGIDNGIEVNENENQLVVIKKRKFKFLNIFRKWHTQQAIEELLKQKNQILINK